jgi:hypothetical protein
MVSRHLPLAEGSGCLEEYRAFAQQVLKRTLKKIIFHGHKRDARETVTVFKDLFTWYWRFATYVLTIFPGITSGVFRGIAYARYWFGLESEVTRRWTQSKNDSSKDK